MRAVLIVILFFFGAYPVKAQDVATEKFTLRIVHNELIIDATEKKMYRVVFVNPQGEIVHECQNTQSCRINLEGLPSGKYLYKIDVLPQQFFGQIYIN